MFLRSAGFNHMILRLQKAIDNLMQWFQLWRTEVNVEKSAAIYFNYSIIKRTLVVPNSAPTLRISNNPIPCQHNYKYLGITLDKHPHFRVLSAHRCHSEVPTRVMTSRDSSRRGDPSGSPVGESRADGICISISHFECSGQRKNPEEEGMAAPTEESAACVCN
ncbi:hypothetical protein EVAR_46389_1 [Eumeta japonica]|uniref:RNA-directed DNA polymerase from mobile element jockey n=1 Tax=Eumeta variegata TaxID=151549 RepID=A0A4C1WWS1_EUMVA|nr:hypothetical protein EVAR_46389_1 [Eumeta japonica]